MRSLTCWLSISLLVIASAARAEGNLTLEEAQQRLSVAFDEYVTCLGRAAVLTATHKDDEGRGQMLLQEVEQCQSSRRAALQALGVIPSLQGVIQLDMDRTLWPEDAWSRATAQVAQDERPFKPVVEKYLQCLGRAGVAADLAVPADQAAALLSKLKEKCKQERLDDLVLVQARMNQAQGSHMSSSERRRLAEAFSLLMDLDLSKADPLLYGRMRRVVEAAGVPIP